MNVMKKHKIHAALKLPQIQCPCSAVTHFQLAKEKVPSSPTSNRCFDVALSEEKVSIYQLLHGRLGGGV